MNDDDFLGFAPPAFNPAEALQRLRRELRELGLAEREGVFERRGCAIARVELETAALKAGVVKRPSRSGPEWQAKTLRSAAEVRDFVADLKKRLAGWSDRDD
ncbi:hypothetical protein CLD22_01170 [Rubrivivax gelatinosus]|nr:hypothetical protein [Rubrivivax gelatinosus]